MAADHPSAATPPRRRPWGRSLRARLLGLVALALAPAFALVLWNQYGYLRSQRAETAAAAQRIAHSRALEFGEKLDDMRGLLRIVAGQPAVKADPAGPACSEMAREIKQGLPQYGNLGAVSADGRLVCSAEPFNRAAPPGVTDRLWFRRAVASGDFALGEFVVGRSTGINMLVAGQPVRNAQGQLTAVGFAGLDLAWLSRFVSDLPVHAGAALVVLDGSGRILARHPDHAAWVGKPHPEAAQVRAALGRSAEGTLALNGPDGARRLGAYARVPHTDVTVYYGVPEAAAQAHARQESTENLALMTAILLGSFGLSWLAAEMIVLRRTQHLSDTAARLAAGDLDARSGGSGPDEIGQLAAAFDQMADAVTERERRLERANRALRIVNASTHELLHGGSEAALMGGICRHIVHEGGYLAAWVGRRADSPDQRIDYVAGEGVDDALAAVLRHLTWGPGSGSLAGTAIREGHPVILQDIATDARAAAWRELALQRGYAAAAAIPIRVGGELWGAISMFSAAAQAFRIDEIELLTGATDDLAIGLGALRSRARERAAQEANRIKSDFLASMSHELRTPLNAIIGFSEVLADGMAGDVTPQQREYLHDILASGQHLLALINDILDLSKVEAGRMALELECVPVESALRAALSVVREKALAHRLALTLDVAPDAGELCADPRKVKQIVYNLLSNAVKFTPEGGRVDISARRVGVPGVPAAAPPPPGTHEYLEIAVSDTGIGIAPEDQVRLFVPFTQIDSSLSRQYTGTGLGLSLVKRLAELHGGAVELQSKPGDGSTFRVWLPLRPVFDCLAARRDAAARPPITSGGHVLVVEDETAAYELLRLTLEPHGFSVTRATSAEQARALLATQQPDLIALDLLLPGEDGWQFLDWLKHDAHFAHIPVVVTSIVADERKGFALGASAVLQKPFLKEDLARALASLGFLPQHTPPARVLVIDDEPADLERMAVLLASDGHAVERAQGGREGIVKALAAPPDLILLDLMMPEVSGFDVVAALRTDSRTVFTPIVVVTAKTLTRAERDELDLRVHTVLHKSEFSPEVFLGEVRRALTAAPPVRAANAPTEHPQGRAAPSPPPEGDKETWGGPAFP